MSESALKRLKLEMIKEYGTICWFGNIKDNKLTAHHIIPRRENGATTWENIALLNRKWHDFFNLIELRDPKTARELNELFYELNRTFAPPTPEHFEEINGLLQMRGWDEEQKTLTLKFENRRMY